MRNATIRKKAILMQAFLSEPARIILGVPSEESDWASICHQQFWSVAENRAVLGATK